MKLNTADLKKKCTSALAKVVCASKLTLKIMTKLATAMLLAVTLIYVGAKAPEIHGYWIRDKVGSKTYKIFNPKGGSGTGFAVKAKSGITYIVTNDHVCRGASYDGGNNVMIEDRDGNVMSRRVLLNSDRSDLCLVEGAPGVEGLAVSGSAPHIGQIIAAVGHPAGYDLTLSRGEIIMAQDVGIPLAVVSITNPNTGETMNVPKEEGGISAEECSKPKNRIQDGYVSIFIFRIPAKICYEVTEKAYFTNMVIQPGNSGSPIVDFWGNVVGVVFAGDRAGWGITVSHKDLVDLLKVY